MEPDCNQFRSEWSYPQKHDFRERRSKSIRKFENSTEQQQDKLCDGCFFEFYCLESFFDDRLETF